MMDDSGTLPVPIGAGGNRALSTLDQLAEIPEEDIWLAKQKSPRGAPTGSTFNTSCGRSRSRRRPSCARPTTRQ